MEVVDNLTLINRVRALEDELNGLKLNKDEVNKTLDLHESEIINHAVHTFTTQQDEMDKELFLNGLPFSDGADWKQCRKSVSDFLVKIPILYICCKCEQEKLSGVLLLCQGEEVSRGYTGRPPEKR